VIHVRAPIPVSLVGCGAAAELYYTPALRTLEREGRVRVIAVCDPVREAAARVGRMFPAAARLHDPAHFSSTGAGLVVVASPARFHAEQTIDALSAGAAVLCEKPMAATVAEAEAMLGAASGRLLAIGLVRRFMPGARAIRRRIESGELGRVESFTISEGGVFRWPARSAAFFEGATGGGGVLLDVGSHVLDLVRWWLGDPTELRYEDDAMGGVEANCRVALGFASGVTGTIRLSRDAAIPNRCAIECERGTVRFDPAEEDFAASFLAQLRNVVAAVEGTESLAVDPRDALEGMRLIERCYRGRSLMAMPWLDARAARRGAVPRIAVLGANGFIGSRTVEMLHLSGSAEVRPVVRRYAALAGLSRFALDCRIADGLDVAALRDAVAGCDVVVHAIAGDRRTIVASAAAAYRAAEAAGVRRLVYLSTSCVHGQAPVPGTLESTPPPASQALPYNAAKARAERDLLALRARGRVELVILRPGIVYGPRSRWTAGLADELLSGAASLVDGGDAVCNCIYVDNLVHAILLAASSPEADGEAFFVGDAEWVTWRDLYLSIGHALGIDVREVASETLVDRGLSWPERLERLLVSSPAQAALSLVAPELRARARRLVPGLRDIPPAGADAAPVVSREMALLQQCRYRLPMAKAEALLGYRPVVSFEEGCRRSVAWLEFAGYPVVTEAATAMRATHA
jgi:predicted dehydrogenase/nucleoside-diphosphate-sugar epimerase